MSQHRKHRGYATQRLLAEWLQRHGFPWAMPVGAGRSGSDITGVVGIDIEVKARAGLDLAGLMRQLRSRAHEGLLGVGVLRLNGQGQKSIEDWVVVMRLGDWVRLVRDAGFGDPR